MRALAQHVGGGDSLAHVKAALAGLRSLAGQAAHSLPSLFVELLPDLLAACADMSSEVAPRPSSGLDLGFVPRYHGHPRHAAPLCCAVIVQQLELQPHVEEVALARVWRVEVQTSSHKAANHAAED